MTTIHRCAHLREGACSACLGALIRELQELRGAAQQTRNAALEEAARVAEWALASNAPGAIPSSIRKLKEGR